MSRFLNEAKSFVMQSFSTISCVGDTIDMRYIVQKQLTISPPARDEIENAIQSLINEGVLEPSGAITKFGIDRFFPLNVGEIKRSLLILMKNKRMREGDHLDWQTIMHNITMSASFGERQRNAFFEEVLPSLVSDGVLINPSEGCYLLTRKGYEFIY